MSDNKEDFMKVIATAEIGGLTPAVLLAQMKMGRVKTNEWSEHIVMGQKALPVRFKVKLVSIWFPFNLPLVNKKSIIPRGLYEEAFEKGLCLLPALAGPDIILQIEEQGLLRGTSLAMQQIDCPTHGNQSVQKNILCFSDDSYLGIRYRGLYAQFGDMDQRFGDGGKFIFAYQCPELIEAGCTTLPPK